ncbi:MAG: sarcosine oxidase [Thermomicrobiales bacterium]|jgi:sarcosine oxidase|nr:sarcosine oxidase [Thermomicrobiales bacterium]MEA2596924.1 sarcosine oxidase [Thermomicrobiales bacterium]
MDSGQSTASSGYDVIVIGVGGMGSAACYHLARRGKRVLGLERFDVPHAMGSSHGVNRIIRLAYYEDPSYVPLLRRAYELWRELQSDFGEQLLHITGSADASDEHGEVFQGALRSCELHDLPHEVLSSADLTRRFPAFRLPSDHFALYQPEGGFLLSERCVVAHVFGALAAGAEIRAREQVLSWTATASGVRVVTDRGSYEAERLIISAGAWMQSLVPALTSLAQPERQVLAWFQPTSADLFAPARFPVFNLSVDEGRYYGFPVFGIPGFKVGRYHHREEQIDPDDFDRAPNPADEAVLREFAARYFPAGAGPTMAMMSCIFTNTPDEHFVIDVLPDAPQVVVASPCSGHGFKFCSVVGEILADLASRGATGHDIGLFRLERIAGAGTGAAAGAEQVPSCAG